MIDINNEKYLEELRKAIASKQGQLIIEYLKKEKEKFDYENIITDNQNYSEIGQSLVVYKKINKYLKSILSFFDGQLKD